MSVNKVNGPDSHHKKEKGNRTPMPHAAPVSPPAPSGSGLARLSLFNLTAIALLHALAGLAFAYWLILINRPNMSPQPSTFKAPFVSHNVTGVTLVLPEQWLIATAKGDGSDNETLNVGLSLRFEEKGDLENLGLWIVPANRVESSAQLLDTVYIHEFTMRQTGGKAGLIGKPLKGEEGYENETVWYDPLSANPFVAKCTDRPAAPDFPDCIRTVKPGHGLAITYQFNHRILQYWRTFDATLSPILGRTGLLHPNAT